jgi:hypothetical protein
MLIYFFCLVIGLVLIGSMFIRTNNQVGGSRTSIFSRFSYQPEFPFISQLDVVDLNRFSKVYNITGPIKFIHNRPYRYYHSKNSDWLYPWEFPQEINYPCIRLANSKCHDNTVQIMKEGGDKLDSIAIHTKSDIVKTSPCFNRVYDECLKKIPK